MWWRGCRRFRTGLQLQVLGGRDDSDALVHAEGEQVFVGDHEIGVGALSAFEEFVVVGITTELYGATDCNANRAIEPSLPRKLSQLTAPSKSFREYSNSFNVDLVTRRDYVFVDRLSNARVGIPCFDAKCSAEMLTFESTTTIIRLP